jgi:RNA polymerase sigma factor (sigma-70 family)
MIVDEAAFESQPSADTEGRTRSKGCVRWEPLLTADEERELSARILGGDQAARRRLILANLRVVVEIARRFRGGKVPLDDLIQEGNLGLIRASADFDPSVHGCRFYTYAEVWIRAFIHRALIANDSLIRIPQHVFLGRKQSRRDVSAKAAVVAGAGANEAGPATVESGDRETVGVPRRLDPDRTAGPGRVAHGPAAEGEIVPLTEAIVDNRRPEQQVTDQERRLVLELALRGLNPVEAWVIRERYGLGGSTPEEQKWSSPVPRTARRDEPEAGADPDSPTQCRAFFYRSYVELARDCGLSRYRIRQVEEAALEKLRDVLRPGLVQTP